MVFLFNTYLVYTIQNKIILKQKTKQNGTIQFKLVQKPETKAVR